MVYRETYFPEPLPLPPAPEEDPLGPFPGTYENVPLPPANQRSFAAFSFSASADGFASEKPVVSSVNRQEGIKEEREKLTDLGQA